MGAELNAATQRETEALTDGAPRMGWNPDAQNDDDTIVHGDLRRRLSSFGSYANVLHTKKFQLMHSKRYFHKKT